MELQWPKLSGIFWKTIWQFQIFDKMACSRYIELEDLEEHISSSSRLPVFFQICEIVISLQFGKFGLLAVSYIQKYPTYNSYLEVFCNPINDLIIEHFKPTVFIYNCKSLENEIFYFRQVIESDNIISLFQHFFNAIEEQLHIEFFFCSYFVGNNV